MIFISYRREDSAIFVGRLFDRLSALYSSKSVFLDIHGINPAEDFRKAIDEKLSSSVVVLAVIGPKWLGESNGKRRIDELEDYVRIEIAKAISQRIKVIPVYIDETPAIVDSILPTDLVGLAYANALWVDSGRDFDLHVERLVSSIDRIAYPTSVGKLTSITGRFARSNSRWLATLTFLFVLLFLFRDFFGALLLTRHGIPRELTDDDPHAFFSKSTDVELQIARALADRESLKVETDLAMTISQTTETFDLFALTGSAFLKEDDTIMPAVVNGVNFRIILVDHSPVNRQNVDQFFQLMGQFGFDFEESQRKLQSSINMYRRILSESRKHKGSVELRLWKGPYINSFWIRDGQDSKSKLAHVEVMFYGDVLRQPSIRFGKLSPNVISNLQATFNAMWESELCTLHPIE